MRFERPNQTEFTERGERFWNNNEEEMKFSFEREWLKAVRRARGRPNYAMGKVHEPWTRRGLWQQTMVGEMVQNSQSLYSFTFNAVIVIHEYIYSHSTTNFTLKKYIYSHLTMYFLFTNIFTLIYEIYSFTFNRLYSFTFTIEIFIQHFLRTPFAHH